MVEHILAIDATFMNIDMENRLHLSRKLMHVGRIPGHLFSCHMKSWPVGSGIDAVEFYMT